MLISFSHNFKISIMKADERYDIMFKTKTERSVQYEIQTDE